MGRPGGMPYGAGPPGGGYGGGGGPSGGYAGGPGAAGGGYGGSYGPGGYGGYGGPGGGYVGGGCYGGGPRPTKAQLRNKEADLADPDFRRGRAAHGPRFDPGFGEDQAQQQQGGGGGGPMYVRATYGSEVSAVRLGCLPGGCLAGGGALLPVLFVCSPLAHLWR